ncbi:hypothetical protein HMPREF9569_00855, partial [Cutibacterium acnes HL078PA1]
VSSGPTAWRGFVRGNHHRFAGGDGRSRSSQGGLRASTNH